uniref:TIR domain-containing protein n=1 Tax=Candidatus Kentrum sp. MB TaxID=2138164 RepID=A0A450XZ40_9GAMM|nr:MAG: TIR domain-containing protein [Candidatus Kentron sp. MB]VFK34513.1 MAG: TIR domain-containing protein [Candidatus Kentron sp. MB]VFK76794.1 MAG: TIR domain-containing protein [Candidatus Kentron sp. MB]
MANLFLSYRRPDLAQAERLALALKAAGHEVWFDEWNIRIGDSIVERMDQGLTGMSYLIFCYSAAGMSPWINREWMSTLARQLSGHSVKILPVLLSGDADAAPAILADIKYANLTRDWERDLQELLRAIS